MTVHTPPICNLASSSGPVHGVAVRCKRASGFTLIELVIVMLIIGILASIAYPSYISYITRSNRTAAEACLSNYANYMERYYTTNLSYAQDTSGNAMNTAALQALGFNCATTQNTGQYYQYQFPAAPTSSTYTLDAVPQGIQATRDTECATLSLDQAGTRLSSTGSNACW